MTDQEGLELAQKNIAGLLRYAIRLHCRHEATKGALIGYLAGGDKAKMDEMLRVLQCEADKLAERILLQIGDSNPEGADLLGVQEFLRKLQSEQ